MQPPYGGWNQTQMNNEQIDLHSQSESQPQSELKRPSLVDDNHSHSHNSQSQPPWMVRSLNRALPVNKGTANIFYKTRICKRFWAGFCRKGEQCKFAHGIEELRQPPSNWQDLVGPEPVRETGTTCFVGKVEGEAV
ncbi:unnamed protein product [Arabis nemorensis]|uniref:C3H1-type domain-containing protein n=1 Tax=Arabis nemorensis TaxID=586526 RepID=A0A565AY69_9BRAS|nr:unnamed protein product [Arabis nemorensis]